MPGPRCRSDTECEERGVYVVAGEIDVSGDRFGAGQLLVFRPTDRITISRDAPARFAVIGGAALDGPARSGGILSPRARNASAGRSRRREGKFCRVPGDEIEFIRCGEQAYTAGG